MREGTGRDVASVDPGTPAFGETLAGLREEGSGFLVAGAVDADVHRESCRQFLGRESPESHAEVVVGAADERSPGPTDPHPGGRRRTVELATEYRSTTAASSPAGDTATGVPSGPSTADAPSGPGRNAVEDEPPVATDLARLGEETMDAMAALEPVDGYEPGELRVCLDAVDVGVERFGEAEFFRFVHLLSGAVGARRGLLHVHFRGEPETPTCRLLEPLFDGLVELRGSGDGAEQRWLLREAELTSEWLAVDP